MSTYGSQRRSTRNNPLYARLPNRKAVATKEPNAYSAAPFKEWYQSKWWYAARAAQRRDFPLCVMCERQGITRKMDVVDHVRPHRGDPRLFFNRSNLQSLCYPHHNGVKAEQEKNPGRGADAEGNPLVPKEGW